MLGGTIDPTRRGVVRLATVAAFAVVFGLTSGWAAGHFKPSRAGKHPASDGVVSAADRIKTDLWKTFAEKGAVVMIGDSHTDYADWPAMFPQARIVNRGVAGDTTGAVLARLDTILSVSASTAVVTIGTNDILRGDTLSAVKANYHAILDRLAGNGLQVIVTSTPLTDSRRRNAQVVELNADVRAYCAHQRCTFVDLNAAIGADGLLIPAMTVDGIHLNGAGYARWAAALAPHIRSEMAARQ